MDSNKIIDEVLCELEKDGHKMTRRDVAAGRRLVIDCGDV